MKKVFILSISMLLISGSNVILAMPISTSTPDNQSNLSNTQSQLCQENQINNSKNNTEIKPTTNTATEVEQNKTYELDELDDLSQQAEDNGIKITAPATPTYLMNIVRKFGVIFFLRPYIFVVDNYRIAKNFVIKYATMAWDKIVGKEPETVENGKKQE